MSNSPLVSVIIPVLNDVERLKPCLESLTKQTLPKDQYEVIVVDNGPSDEIKNCVAEFEGMRYLVQTVRSSYASRNLGIKSAKGEFLAFTDADCLSTPTWLEKGIECFKNTPNCGLVAGHIELFAADPQNPKPVELFDMITELCQDKYVKRWKFGATANVITHRQIFEAVGVFNDSLKSGGDMEWGQRVNCSGYQVIYCPEAIILHPTRNSWQSVKNKTIRVIGGVHDVHSSKSVKKLINDLLKDWPKWSDFQEIAQDQRLKSNKDRLGVLGVTLGVKWVRSTERVRLFFGGQSQNL